MTSFNYGGKKAVVVGFICRWYLSNTKPDSTFYDTTGWGLKQLLLLLLLCFFCFFRGGNRCLPQHRKDGLSLITITPVGMGSLKL